MIEDKKLHDNLIYNIDANIKFKKFKIKKRRVLDASKLLKLIQESQEQGLFKAILNKPELIKPDCD